MKMRRVGMSLQPPLQSVLLVASLVIFSTTRTILIDVSAWIARPPSPAFRGHRSPFRFASHRRISSSLNYQKGGGKENRRIPQKKDQQRQQSEFFFNSTGLYYMNDDGADIIGTNDTTLVSSSCPPPKEAAVSATGNFGDIMSHGLVTSETYSLEDIYGISNPLDRMAVTANGNLQRLFSSYYDAPVAVEMVHCTRQEVPNLDAIESSSDFETTAIWHRRVLLKIFGNQTFCTADSVVEVHSREVEDLVESRKVGIGQLFRHFNILPEFTLVAAGPRTDGGFWRNYTLESDLVTCSIHEVFCNNVWELSPDTSQKVQ